MSRHARRYNPSKEVVPTVSTHREQAGRRICMLDPKHPQAGSNALDWIGRFG
jgi:type IV secretory pathway TraG/TraD family ATPase VirD4